MSDVIAQALREYGRAIRSDWSDLDGRSVRNQLDAIAAAMDSGEHHDIAYWRDRLGICPGGAMHWTTWCEDDDYCNPTE